MQPDLLFLAGDIRVHRASPAGRTKHGLVEDKQVLRSLLPTSEHNSMVCSSPTMKERRISSVSHDDHVESLLVLLCMEITSFSSPRSFVECFSVFRGSFRSFRERTHGTHGIFGFVRDLNRNILPASRRRIRATQGDRHRASDIPPGGGFRGKDTVWLLQRWP